MPSTPTPPAFPAFTTLRLLRAPAAGVSPAAAAPSPPVNFEIQAGFRARNGVSDLATLQQLQADGLLRRLRVLQQQGVQP